MKKQLFTLLTVLLLTPFFAFAEYDEDASCAWSVKQENAIGRTRKVYVDFNTKKTIYCDLPLSECGNEAMTTIKKFQNWIIKGMNDKTNTIEFLSPDEDMTDNDFVATIFIKEITEKGGVKLRMELVQRNNPDCAKVYNLKVKDRKWNDTESLLKENTPKLCEELESDIWWTSHNGAKK